MVDIQYSNVEITRVIYSKFKSYNEIFEQSWNIEYRSCGYLIFNIEYQSGRYSKFKLRNEFFDEV